MSYFAVEAKRFCCGAELRSCSYEVGISASLSEQPDKKTGNFDKNDIDISEYRDNSKYQENSKITKSAENDKNDEKNDKKSFAELMDEQTRQIKDLFGRFEDEDAQLSGIRRKLYGGMSLTPAERDYLAKKDPSAYENYLETERARKMYRAMLKNCRTRDEVTAMRLSNALGAYSGFKKSAKSGAGDAVRGMNAAIEREIGDYMRSADYRKLPTAAQRDKYYADLAKAKKNERDAQRARQLEIAEKRAKSLEEKKKIRQKRKKLQKNPGDGKLTVAQVMASANGRKVQYAQSKRDTAEFDCRANSRRFDFYKQK